MSRILRLISLLVVMTTGAQAEDVPPLTGRVNDLANVISPAGESRLENLLAKLEQDTTAQVAILTMPEINDESLEDFSLRVATTWALGQADKDNGLLILYLVDEDRTRIEVGYGLEGAIPDGQAGDILRNHFRKYAPKEGAKDFDQAFVAAVERVAVLVTADAAIPSPKAAEKWERGDFILILVGLVLVVFVLWLIARRKSEEDNYSSYSYRSSSPSYRSVSSGRASGQSSRAASTPARRRDDSDDSPSSISIGTTYGGSSEPSGGGNFSGSGGNFGGGGASD